MCSSWFYCHWQCTFWSCSSTWNTKTPLEQYEWKCYMRCTCTCIRRHTLLALANGSEQLDIWTGSHIAISWRCRKKRIVCATHRERNSALHACNTFFKMLVRFQWQKYYKRMRCGTDITFFWCSWVKYLALCVNDTFVLLPHLHVRIVGPKYKTDSHNRLHELWFLNTHICSHSTSSTH